MKKNNITLLILLCITNIVGIAQSVNKKVLLTLGKNEILWQAEYVSNLKFSQGKYACVLRDTILKKTTFVWNGKRIATEDRLYIDYLDLNDLNKCIYNFYDRSNSSYYLVLQGDKIGPYEYIQYPNPIYRVWGDNSINPTFLHRNYYHFRTMDTWYTHDYDGIVYKRKEGRFNFTSPSKNHTATLSENKRLLTIDGNNYVIPLPVDIKAGTSPEHYIYLMDNGDCYCEFIGVKIITGSGESNYEWSDYAYYISNNELISINLDNEYFDLETLSITKLIENNTLLEPFRFRWIYLKDVKKLKLAFEKVMHDKSGKNMFAAKWEHDYVLINGKKYGKNYPLEAYYDENSNSFVWTTIEGNQLVQYIYKCY